MPLAQQHRLVFPYSTKIFLKKYEICSLCVVCDNWFVCRHRDTKYCSQTCWRKIPKQIEWRRKYKPTESTLAIRKAYRESSAGRATYRRIEHRGELKKALKGVGEKLIRNEEVKTAYLRLVRAIKRNKKVFVKGGTPDARKTLVEFKFGLDWLRKDQIILDILKGRKGKVRWPPSYDSLEATLSGKTNESILFPSYLAYLVACEETRSLNF